MGSNTDNVSNLIKKGIERFSILAPVESLLMVDRNKLLKKERIKFLEGVNFGEVDDEFSFANFYGCEVEIIAKGKNIYNEGSVLFIKRSLFDKLDNISKAGMFLNYLINQDRTFLLENKKTANARHINALIASDKIRRLPQEDLFFLREYFQYRPY